MLIKKIKDCEEIYAIINECANSFYNQSFNNPSVIKQLAHKFHNYANFIAVFIEDKVAGFIAYYNNNFETKTAFISMIIIKKEFSGRGLGTKLLNYCCNDSYAKGMVKIGLEVNSTNTTAIAFYFKNKFCKKNNTDENTLYFEKKICDGMVIMKSTKMEDLLKDGVSKKFASYYLNLVEKEKNNKSYNQNYVKWAHERGFLAESAYAYGLNDDNYKNYLSDYDFYKVWPLNNWTRIWINDKLTLKYILGEEKFKNFMPKYYFYSTTEGLKTLTDFPYETTSGTTLFDSFKKLLQNVKEFACKPCNGTTSLGFFKLSFNEGKYCINDEPVEENYLKDFINEHPNYIFTEYLKPSVEFSKYSPMIHTLRLVTLNTTGNNPEIIGGYLRIPNTTSGAANYVILDDKNQDKFNIFLDINTETGEYGNAKLTFLDCVKNADVHPDTGIKLCGKIADYNSLKNIILDIAHKFNTLTYMGFDIGITTNGFKCMEINSHPGIKYMQIFKSLYDNQKTSEFFNKRITEINELSEEDKIIRNNILR